MMSNAVISFPPGTDLAPPPRSLAIRANEFDAWLVNAKPGARIEYHRGFLPLDRDRGFSPFSERHRRELIDIAARAMALTEAGRVLLVQQRHGCGDYSYFAIKSKRSTERRFLERGQTPRRLQRGLRCTVHHSER